MSDQKSPQHNALLGALRGEERTHLFAQLEAVPLTLGQILCEAGEPFTHAYFPVEGIVSILYVMENAASAEIAVVGNEGMIGVALFMGGQSTLSRSIVQNAGYAYRMSGQQIQQAFNRGGRFQTLLLHFVHALITQMVQTAACNRHHSVDQQLCRWLLMSLDRLPSNQLRMTQKLIGNMLGIESKGVTAAAFVLEKAGLITFDNGHITVVDRAGLEARSCECYNVVKKECDRLIQSAASDGGPGPN